MGGGQCQRVTGVVQELDDNDYCNRIREMSVAVAAAGRPQPQPGQLTDWGLFLGGMTEATDGARLAELGVSSFVNMASSVCIYTPRGAEPRDQLETLPINAPDEEGYQLLQNHL